MKWKIIYYELKCGQWLWKSNILEFNNRKKYSEVKSFFFRDKDPKFYKFNSLEEITT